MFDVSYPDKEKGTALQEKLAHFFNQKLYPALQSFIDEQPNLIATVHISLLEINIGSISIEDIGTTMLATKIISNFRDALRPYIKNLKTQQLVINDLITTQQQLQLSQLRLIEYYLSYGSMPWWASGKAMVDPIEAIKSLLISNPHLFINLLLKIGSNSNVRLRLALQLSSVTIQDIIRRLNPVEADFIINYHKDLSNIQAKKQIVKSELSVFKQKLWEFILSFLLVQRSSVFSQKMFVKETLKNIASYFNISIKEIIDIFYQIALIDDQTIGSIATLRNIIKMLGEEETDFEPTLVEFSTSEIMLVDETEFVLGEKQLLALQYFLLQGVLPWWAKGDKMFEPTDLVLRFLRSADQNKLILFFIKIDNTRQVAKNLSMLSNETKHAILIILAPTRYNLIIDYAKEFTKFIIEQILGGHNDNYIQKTVWEHILKYLLHLSGTDFNEADFSKTVLHDIVSIFSFDFAMSSVTNSITNYPLLNKVLQNAISTIAVTEIGETPKLDEQANYLAAILYYFNNGSFPTWAFITSYKHAIIIVNNLLLTNTIQTIKILEEFYHKRILVERLLRITDRHTISELAKHRLSNHCSFIEKFINAVLTMPNSAKDMLHINEALLFKVVMAYLFNKKQHFSKQEFLLDAFVNSTTTTETLPIKYHTFLVQSIIQKNQNDKDYNDLLYSLFEVKKIFLEKHMSGSVALKLQPEFNETESVMHVDEPKDILLSNRNSVEVINYTKEKEVLVASTNSDLLKYFTLYENMPWWLEEVSKLPYDKLLDELLANDGDEAKHLFKFAGSNQKRMDFWLQKFSSFQIKKIIELLPNGVNMLLIFNAILKGVQAHFINVYLSVREIEYLGLKTIWQAYARSGYNSFNPALLIVAFIQHIEVFLRVPKGYLNYDLANSITPALVAYNYPWVAKKFFLLNQDFVFNNDKRKRTALLSILVDYSSVIGTVKFLDLIAVGINVLEEYVKSSRLPNALRIDMSVDNFFKELILFLGETSPVRFKAIIQELVFGSASWHNIFKYISANPLLAKEYLQPFVETSYVHNKPKVNEDNIRKTVFKAGLKQAKSIKEKKETINIVEVGRKGDLYPEINNLLIKKDDKNIYDYTIIDVLKYFTLYEDMPVWAYNFHQLTPTQLLDQILENYKNDIQLLLKFAGSNQGMMNVWLRHFSVLQLSQAIQVLPDGENSFKLFYFILDSLKKHFIYTYLSTQKLEWLWIRTTWQLYEKNNYNRLDIAVLIIAYIREIEFSLRIPEDNLQCNLLGIMVDAIGDEVSLLDKFHLHQIKTGFSEQLLSKPDFESIVQTYYQSINKNSLSGFNASVIEILEYYISYHQLPNELIGNLKLGQFLQTSINYLYQNDPLLLNVILQKLVFGTYAWHTLFKYVANIPTLLNTHLPLFVEAAFKNNNSNTNDIEGTTTKKNGDIGSALIEYQLLMNGNVLLADSFVAVEILIFFLNYGVLPANINSTMSTDDFLHELINLLSIKNPALLTRITKSLALNNNVWNAVSKHLQNVIKVSGLNNNQILDEVFEDSDLNSFHEVATIQNTPFLWLYNDHKINKEDRKLSPFLLQNDNNVNKIAALSLIPINYPTNLFKEISDFIFNPDGDYVNEGELMKDAEVILENFLLFNNLPEGLANSSITIRENWLKKLLVLIIRKKPSLLGYLLQHENHSAENLLLLYRIFRSGENIAERSVLNLLDNYIEKDIVRIIIKNSYTIGNDNNIRQLLDKIKFSIPSNEWVLTIIKLVAANKELIYHFAKYFRRDEIYTIVEYQLSQDAEQLFYLQELGILLHYISLQTSDSSALLLIYHNYMLEYVMTNVFSGFVQIFNSFILFLEKQNNLLFFKVFPILLDIIVTKSDEIKILKRVGKQLENTLVSHANRSTNQLMQSIPLAEKNNPILLNPTTNQQIRHQPATTVSKIEYPALTKEQDVVINDRIYIQNAGLVLFAPLLSTYFSRLSLLDKGKFSSQAAALRGVHLLQYLVDGLSVHSEHLLVLNKLLCNVPFSFPIENFIELTDVEIEVSHQLFSAIKQQWPKIKNTSNEGLQVSFLQREGILTHGEDGWNLRVDQKPYDIILQTLPWGIGMVKTPWMEKILTVEWI